MFGGSMPSFFFGQNILFFLFRHRYIFVKKNGALNIKCKFDEAVLLKLKKGVISNLCFSVISFFAYFRNSTFKLRYLIKNMLGRHSKDFNNFIHLIHFVGARKQRFSSMHFNQDTSQRPHVNGQVIWNT